MMHLCCLLTTLKFHKSNTQNIFYLKHFFLLNTKCLVEKALTADFASVTFFFRFADVSSIPFCCFLFFSASLFFFLSSKSAIKSGQSKFSSGSHVFSELQRNITKYAQGISNPIIRHWQSINNHTHDNFTQICFLSFYLKTKKMDQLIFPSTLKLLFLSLLFFFLAYREQRLSIP